LRWGKPEIATVLVNDKSVSTIAVEERGMPLCITQQHGEGKGRKSGGNVGLEEINSFLVHIFSTSFYVNAGATWHFRVLVYVNAYHGAMNPWFGADGPDGEARIRA
jgi:hypothetical protein